MLPLFLTVMLLALGLWALAQGEKIQTPQITSVVGPGEIPAQPKESLSLEPARLPGQGEVAFIKLVARKERHSYKEGWSGETRNLMVLKHNATESSWLSLDQFLMSSEFGLIFSVDPLPIDRYAAGEDKKFNFYQI